MKFKSITAFCLFGLFLCSCNREELPEGVDNKDRVLHAGLVSVQSKTWLDSEGSGENPTKKVYWSDGDRINVNGQNSLPISVSEGAKVSEADFHLRSVDGPYNVIYPHDIIVDEAYDEEGGITISLSSTQAYNPTTFASGSAVMYAYSETEDVSLKNLCAAVRVNLVGTAAVSSAVLVSESSEAPLCGTYRLCPKTGELAPVEGETTLSLEFENLTLSAEGTDFYFAIPAGNYSAGLSLYFTNASDGRKMQCVWKPKAALEAGRLYSFNDVEYSPEAKDIESALEWEEFVMALSGEGDLGKYLYKDGTVRLGADIEGELSSITTDFLYCFDGNGKTITRENATAALFSSVSGEVKNLTLAGKVSLITGGASIVDELKGGKITNCTNVADIVFDAAAHGNVAGIVRLVSGGTIEGCTNSGSINAKVDVSAANYNAVVGGVISQIHASDNAVAVKDCSNTAEIILAPVSGQSNGTGMAVCGLGGIAGWLRSASSIVFDNCDNSGAVTLSADNVVSDRGFIAYSMSVGGVVGLATPINASGDNQGLINTPSGSNGLDVCLKNCDNAGVVHNCGINYSTTKQTNTKIFTGGLAGSLLGNESKYAEISNCSNTGNVYTYDLIGESSSSRPGYSAVVGGLVGFGGYLDIKGTTVNCQVGSGKRPVVAMAGVIGFAERPFNLTESKVYITGYFQRFEGYKGNRAVVAVVPVRYGTKEADAMGMVPIVNGSTITNCNLGGLVLSLADPLKKDTKEDVSETLTVKLFNNADKVYKEDGTVNNLVCGQGYTTVATDVTVTGITYWNGK